MYVSICFPVIVSKLIVLLKFDVLLSFVLFMWINKHQICNQSIHVWWVVYLNFIVTCLQILSTLGLVCNHYFDCDFLLFSTIGNFYFVDVWTVLIAVITLITKFKVNVVFHWCSNAIKRNIWACSWIFKRHLSDVHWTISKQTNFSQMLVWQLSFQDILNTIK